MNPEELVGFRRRLYERERRTIRVVSDRPKRHLYPWPLGGAVVVSLVAQAALLLPFAGGAVVYSVLLVAH